MPHQIKSPVYRELLHNLSEIYNFFDYQEGLFQDGQIPGLQRNIFEPTKELLESFVVALRVAFKELEYQQFILQSSDIPVCSLSFKIEKKLKTFNSCEKRITKVAEYSGMLSNALEAHGASRTARIVTDFFVDFVAITYAAATYV